MPAASELEVDPDWIVVARVTAQLGTPSDAGSGELRRKRAGEPDLVDQLIIGRLVRGFEAVAPRPVGCGRVVLGGRPIADSVDEPVDEPKFRAGQQRLK